MPFHLTSCFVLIHNKNTIIVITTQNIKSTKTFSFISIGRIVEDNPKINNILKIFDPNTLPKAISFSPFLAATKRCHKFW